MQVPPVTLELTIPSDVRYLACACQLAEAIVRSHVAAPRADPICAAVDVSLSEALTNVIRHAHGSDASKPVRIAMRIEGGVLSLSITDQGPGFDMGRIPPPSFETLQEGGRGIFIILHSMDEVRYRRAADGNVLEMHKRL